MTYRFLSFVSLLVLVSACSSTPSSNESPSRTASTQPAADAPLSPEEAHRLARANVEPTKIGQKNAYVKTVAQLEEEKARRAAEQAKEAQQREIELAKAEESVGTMQADFKGIKDTINRNIIEPIENILPAAGTPKEYKPTSTIQNVRTGEYADKTRLVFDLNAPAEFSYDVDNAQNLLVIRLPQSDWNAANEKILSTKAIKAYAAKPAQNGGTLVAVKLNGPAKVLRSEKLGVNAAGHHRIFLDVAKL